jgi:hypothetical protein
MPNRNLTKEELAAAHELLAGIRARLKALSGDDTQLLFAYRRKIVKELQYDERTKPASRGAIKKLKWAQQSHRCAHCGEEMPLAYSELDRRYAMDGYTVENTELVHAQCHHDRQRAKRYT